MAAGPLCNLGCILGVKFAPRVEGEMAQLLSLRAFVGRKTGAKGLFDQWDKGRVRINAGSSTQADSN